MTAPPPPEPIAESEDGAVKVMSLADAETGDTFTYGNTWGIHGEGFTGSAPGWTAVVSGNRGGRRFLKVSAPRAFHPPRTCRYVV